MKKPKPNKTTKTKSARPTKATQPTKVSAELVRFFFDQAPLGVWLGDDTSDVTKRGAARLIGAVPQDGKIEGTTPVGGLPVLVTAVMSGGRIAESSGRFEAVDAASLRGAFEAFRMKIDREMGPSRPKSTRAGASALWQFQPPSCDLDCELELRITVSTLRLELIHRLVKGQSVADGPQKNRLPEALLHSLAPGGVPFGRKLGVKSRPIPDENQDLDDGATWQVSFEVSDGLLARIFGRMDLPPSADHAPVFEQMAEALDRALGPGKRKRKDRTLMAAWDYGSGWVLELVGKDYYDGADTLPQVRMRAGAPWRADPAKLESFF